jgi:hypothetical protein
MRAFCRIGFAKVPHMDTMLGAGAFPPCVVFSFHHIFGGTADISAVGPFR